MITIDKRLNLVVPIIRGDETKLYVHSTPIRPETFEMYHMVMAKTFSAFAQNGLDPRSGPSVAAMILKGVAKDTARGPGVDWWEGDDGVGGKAGLMAEIMRLSNVLTPQPDKGWGTMPLAAAIEKGLMDPEEKSEAMNLLVFFTVVSLVAPRVDRPRLVKGMAAIYELQTTLLNSTEFAASLKTSMIAESSGESAAE